MFLLSSFCSRNKVKPSGTTPTQRLSSTKIKQVNTVVGTYMCFCDDGEGASSFNQTDTSVPHKITNLEWMLHCSVLETRVNLLKQYQLCVSPERSQSTSTKSPVWHLCVFVTRAKFVRLFRLRTRSPTWKGCLIVPSFLGESGSSPNPCRCSKVISFQPLGAWRLPLLSPTPRGLPPK